MDIGLESLGKLTFLRSYSKDGVEAYSDTVERYLQFFRDRFPQFKQQISGYGEVLHNKQAVGSQRLMQFAGPAVTKDEARGYNCGFTGLTSSKDFADMCYLLCCGCGLGASVEEYYVSQMSKVSEGIEETHVIVDSKEGWSDSFKILIDNPLVRFNYSQLRPKGSPISSGGVAGGPEPLEEAHGLIRSILHKKMGLNLSSVDMADFACIVAAAVVSAGVRRSAIIILSDPWDTAMKNYKAGDWWDVTPFRAKANISAICVRNSHEVEGIIDEQLNSPFGERGIVLVNRRNYNDNIGMNPCAEISLKHRSFCNLSSNIVPNSQNADDFIASCRAASFFGTLQASLTNFAYIHEDWKKNSDEDRLIGVSMTGVAQAPKWFTEEVLREAAKQVKEVNAIWSTKLGINPAKRTTTIKPEGSTSCVFSTTSGMHSANFEYGVRRVRVTASTPLAQKLINLYGISESVEVETKYGKNLLPTNKYSFIVKECCSDKDIVLQFPCHYENAIYRNNETSLQALERSASLYKNWVEPGHLNGQETNNVSQTLSFRPEEKEEVKAWLLSNQDKYRAISTLPYDCEAYALMPFEETTYEEYCMYLKQFPVIDWEALGIQSEARSSQACSSGQCEVS